MVVAIRSALIIYSPSSHVKENLLLCPDEWGPFFFSTLQERNFNTRKLNVAHHRASMVGKLDFWNSRQERKKLVSYFYVQFHGGEPTLCWGGAGGWMAALAGAGTGLQRAVPNLLTPEDGEDWGKWKKRARMFSLPPLEGRMLPSLRTASEVMQELGLPRSCFACQWGQDSVWTVGNGQEMQWDTSCRESRPPGNWEIWGSDEASRWLVGY